MRGIDEAVNLLEENRITALPVVDAEGVVVGALNIHDRSQILRHHEDLIGPHGSNVLTTEIRTVLAHPEVGQLRAAAAG